MTNVRFLKISRGYRRTGRGYNKGIILAVIDDQFTIRLREKQGWSCSCGDTACAHPDAVADFVDPATLAAIECP
jgi:hypothetical protein